MAFQKSIINTSKNVENIHKFKPIPEIAFDYCFPVKLDFDDKCDIIYFTGSFKKTVFKLSGVYVLSATENC